MQDSFQVEDKYLLIKATLLIVCLQIELWFVCYYGDKLITEVFFYLISQNRFEIIFLLLSEYKCLGGGVQH